MQYIGYILTAGALLPAIGQIRHSLRCSSVDGVSGATTWAWVCSWSVWVLYGFLTSDTAVVLRNIVGLVPATVMLCVFLRLTTLRGWAPITACYMLATTVMLFNMTAGVWIVVAIDVFFYLPSAVAVFKSREPVGVSYSANIAQVLLTGTWFAYLCATGNAVAGIGWFVGCCCSIVITYKVMVYRRRSASVLHVVSPAVPADRVLVPAG